MADQDLAYARDDDGNMALRTTTTSGDNSTDKDVVWTRDDNGYACVRVLGGSGTSSYTDLTNKPQINSITLTGNKTGAELGLSPSVGTITSGGTITLADNTVYTAGEIASFTVAFPASPTATFTAETDFTSGTTATTLTYPSGMKWSGDDLTSSQFVPVASKRYNVFWWYDGVNWNGVASSRT